MALTEIKYIGTPGLDRGWAATICKTHNYREVATYVYQLEEMECPTCIAKADRERRDFDRWCKQVANSGHPSICLCQLCAPNEYDHCGGCFQPDGQCKCILATIYSPNHCDHVPNAAWGCERVDCQDARCLELASRIPF